MGSCLKGEPRQMSFFSLLSTCERTSQETWKHPTAAMFVTLFWDIFGHHHPNRRRRKQSKQRGMSVQQLDPSFFLRFLGFELVDWLGFFDFARELS